MGNCIPRGVRIHKGVPYDMGNRSSTANEPTAGTLQDIESLKKRVAELEKISSNSTDCKNTREVDSISSTNRHSHGSGYAGQSHQNNRQTTEEQQSEFDNLGQGLSKDSGQESEGPGQVLNESNEEIIVGGMSRKQFDEILNTTRNTFRQNIKGIGISHAQDVRKAHEDAVSKTAKHIRSRLSPCRASNTMCIIRDKVIENEEKSSLQDVYKNLGIEIRIVPALDQIAELFLDHDLIIIFWRLEEAETNEQPILELLTNKHRDVPCLLMIQRENPDEHQDSHEVANVLALSFDQPEFIEKFATNLQEQYRLLDIAAIVSMTTNQNEENEISTKFTTSWEKRVFLTLSGDVPQ